MQLDLSAKDPAGSSSRREEAKRLTALLNDNPAFSFLRLGDGELRFLLLVDQGTWSDDEFSTHSLSASCETALGMLGLTLKDYVRLLNSYQYCDYLDTYSYQDYNSKKLAELELKRLNNQYGPACSATSGIISDWAYFEMHSYLEQHRCLFYGAEADILKHLLEEPSYRRTFNQFWPLNFEAWFYSPPRNGQELSEDLDAIKSFLISCITDLQVDTIFLSLGGAAKILCYEIAKECGVRAIDWGSIMRSLTYSGSDGQSFSTCSA
jgi:hypothetical protein